MVGTTQQGPIHAKFDGYQLSCIDMGLEEIPAEVAAIYGSRVRRLDLSSNKLRSLKLLDQFSKITELVLDNNMLDDVIELPSIPSLRTLSLNKNRISNLEKLLDVVERQCPSITFLSMMSNPACPNEMVWGKDEDDYMRYRRTVIQHLPSLEFLDSSRVSESERAASGRKLSILQRIAPLLHWGSKSKTELPSIDLSVATMDFFGDAKPESYRWSLSNFFAGRKGILGLAPLSDKWIVCCGSDGCIRIFDLTPGKWEYKCVAILRGHAGRVRSVSCFADVRVVSCGDDKTIRVWDLGVQKCLRTLKGHRGTVHCVIALSNGRVVSGGADGTIRVWNVAGKSCSVVLSGHYGSVLTLVETGPNLVASGSSDEQIKLWDLMSQTCIVTLIGHQGDVLAINLMVDGWLVSGSADKTIKIWQQSGEGGSEFHALDPLEPSGRGCVGTLRGHSGAVTSISALPECKILSGSEDKTVALWDVLNSVCLAVFVGHENPIYSVIGLSDGRIASGGLCIKIWDPHNPTMESEDSVALTTQYNKINKSIPEVKRSLWSSTQAGLKGVVANVLKSSRSRAASQETFLPSTPTTMMELDDDDYDDDDNETDQQDTTYATLSTAYPSTICMFATPLSMGIHPGGGKRRRKAVSKGESESRRISSTSTTIDDGEDVKHARNLLNVLFASSKDDGTSGLSNNVLWARVKEWRGRLRKKKGPKVVNWLGIFKARQGQELIFRLDELCRQIGVERVTYIAIKNVLVEEFGEDLFEHMKEQVSVELAMREFEFTKGGSPNKSARGHDGNLASVDGDVGVFFPEVKTPVANRKRPKKAFENVEGEDEEEDDDYPENTLDTSLHDFLTEYFQGIADMTEKTGEEREFERTVKATMSDLESGKLVPSQQNSEPAQLWKAALGNSSFFQEFPDPIAPQPRRVISCVPHTTPPEPEPEPEPEIEIKPELEPEFRAPNVSLQNEIEI